MVDPWNGVKRFNQYQEFENATLALTSDESRSLMSDTFSSFLRTSLSRSEELGAKLETVTLSTQFNENEYFSRQMKEVAKLIKLRSELETERAVFVTQQYGFDTHASFDLPSLLSPINRGLQSFVAEMKAQVVPAPVGPSGALLDSTELVEGEKIHS
jgi:uncharacterized protein (DUF1501 family)